MIVCPACRSILSRSDIDGRSCDCGRLSYSMTFGSWWFEPVSGVSMQIRRDGSFYGSFYGPSIPLAGKARKRFVRRAVRLAVVDLVMGS